MNNSSTFLLESKLRRLKISFSKENDKIIISNAKLDLTSLFLLVILPIIAALGASIVFILTSIGSEEKVSVKILGLIIFLFGVAVVNGLRIRAKLKTNENRKILDNKTITIVENDKTLRFDATNVKDFDYTIEKLDSEIYTGTLCLVDTNDQTHILLGVDEENEQYLLDDLYWFKDYFKKHLEMVTV